MLDQQIHVGPRVRALREAMDLSLRDLATRSGVSAPMLSQVERGETSPTLRVASRIASGLDLRLSQLLRLDEEGTVSIVRAGEGRGGGTPPVTPTSSSPRRCPACAPRSPATRSLPAPSPAARATRPGTSRAPARRRSIERGTLILHVEDAEHELHAGDCVTFDADLSHHFANLGKEKAVLLAIVSAGLRRS